MANNFQLYGDLTDQRLRQELDGVLQEYDLVVNDPREAWRRYSVASKLHSLARYIDQLDRADRNRT